MVNKRFNQKFRRILSVSSLGAFCCSQTINAMLNDSLRSTSLEFKAILLDEVMRDPGHNRNTVEFGEVDGDRRFGTWWWPHKAYDTTKTSIKEKWVYLTYKDDNTPESDIILWKYDHDKAIVLPGNESIWNAITEFHKTRIEQDMQNLKPKKEMEDIAWDRGTEAFIKSLKDQINQEAKRKKDEERSKKEQKEKREQKEKEKREQEKREKGQNRLKAAVYFTSAAAVALGAIEWRESRKS